MDYSKYSEEDFCGDQDFVRWVVDPTDDTEFFWTNFMETYPSKRSEVMRAKACVRTFHFEEYEPSTDDLSRLRQRIWGDLDLSERRERWWNRPVYRAAAAFALLVVSVGLFFLQKDPSSYQTAYGEIRKIELPDGSMVTLNGHSVLKVSDDLAHSMSREVWLEGEGYFDIEKRHGAKFIVHTREAEVEVLGTEFNVATRRKNTRVILHEGKVKLHAGNAETVVMKPGDMATVTDKNQPIRLSVVQPEQYDAWKEALMVLNDKPVLEIVEMLQDNYGIQVAFEDTSFLSKRLNGRLNMKSTDDFVANLAIILDLEVEKRGKGYLFK